MEENFNDVIEKNKNSTLNPEETKKYILSIKGVVRHLYDICKDDESQEEILQDYLEEYENDLKFRGNAQQIFSDMLMYGSYKRILVDAKGNKNSFASVIREAKKKEEEDNKGAVYVKTDAKESMVSAIRYIIRTRHITKEREIIEAIQEEKAKLSKEIKSEMISAIQSSVLTLNEYGFIDEYILSSNEELKELGLGELQYENRNPIADIQYDENGNVVKDVEDIGVIDTFAKDNLEKLSLEDLETMTAFWESKYLQERLGLSKAMATIKTLNLWDTMLHEDDQAIQNLDNNKIKSALKKDLALTYLCRNGSKITGRMKRQYKKFLEKEQIPSETPLDEEITEMIPEISNIEGAAKDVTILECLILYQLKSKDMKIKKWGVIDSEEEQQEDGVTIAIENKNFRGPLIMGVPEYVLEEFFGTSNVDFPKYDKELNETYCSIMSKLYLPTNRYFSNVVRKAYNENPSSPFLAELTGKKVKEKVESEETR